jgi:hypothetical protein
MKRSSASKAPRRRRALPALRLTPPRAFDPIAKAVANEMERELQMLLAEGRERGTPPDVLPVLSKTARVQIFFVQSSAMRKAFEGTAVLESGDVADAVRNIVRCLIDVEEFTRYCRHDNIGTVLGSGDERRRTREEALKHLASAAEQLTRVGDFEAAHQVKTVLERIGRGIHGSLEEYMAGATPARPSRRGKSAANRAGADVHWAVRALAHHVPKDAPKRGTAIAELLALVNISVDPNNVNTTLRRTNF